MRSGITATICALLLCLAPAEAVPGNGLNVRIDGNILRKASGRLVLSFSAFELSGSREVTLENRKTGEKKVFALSSVYRDICYTEPLSSGTLDAIESDDWIPYVVWALPGDPDALRARLSSIYEYQDELRHELGRALLEKGGEELRVTSRLTLNKLEKFHRIATVIATESMGVARERDVLESFLLPLKIRIGFNPFVSHGPPTSTSKLHDVREVIYWEAHRILTRNFGIGDGLVDFVFEAPSTVRSLISFDTSNPGSPSEFAPGVTIDGATIYCALYLQQQEFDAEVKQLVRAKKFLDPFITDRPMVDQVVNEGMVAGIRGNRVAVTFAPPFMNPGETLQIMAGGGMNDEIPVVLVAPAPDGGYTLTGELPDEAIARIRTGMRVLRK